MITPDLLIRVSPSLGEKQAPCPIYVTEKSFHLSCFPQSLQEKDISFFLLCPENLRELTAKVFLDSSSGKKLFPQGMQDSKIIWLRDGEKYKNIRELPGLYQRLIDAGIRRNSSILIMGGGVAGDLGGFLASTILRGVSFCFFPTTLLAAVDSCLGGKLAVNAESGKNMIGVFAQPKMVYIDVKFFSTLPDLEWQCGMAEMIKHGLLSPNQKILKHLENSPLSILRNSTQTLISAIRDSLQVKYDHVKEDPLERQGKRACLNLGHTTAHALESVNQYKLRHGIAVTQGLITMLLLSRKIGLDDKSIDRVIQTMKKSELQLYQISQPAKDIYHHTLSDKKNTSSRHPNFILLRRFGEAVRNQEIKETEFCRAWEEQVEIAKTFNSVCH